MVNARKPLAWLSGEVRTPPFSLAARLEAGTLLRMLQEGVRLKYPQSDPLPEIGPRCLELRIKDANHEWRIICRVDPDVVLILEVFDKKSRKLPATVINNCKRRIRDYDRLSR